MSRYRIVLLGHEEKSIQRSLDAIPDEHRINSVIVVGGINVFAIVEITPTYHVIGEKDESILFNGGKGLVYSRAESSSSSQSFVKPKPAKTKLP